MKMKNKKKYLVWTALIALSVILLFSSGILTAQESSWLDGWDLRKEITITEISGNALTDYQVKIEVGYEPQMKPDFSDLRFTDSDGITLLNYWVEKYTEESSATIWVKVPEIPASGVKKIYMYYGNSGAASLSDGDAVFEFFDDFYTDTKWESSSPSNIYVDTTNHYIVVPTTQNVYIKALNFPTITDFALEYEVEGRDEYLNSRCSRIWIADSIAWLPSNGVGAYHYGGHTGDKDSSMALNARVSGTHYSDAKFYNGNWIRYKVKVTKHGSNAEIEFRKKSDNSLVSSGSVTAPTANLNQLFVHTRPDYYGMLQHIGGPLKVRKYTSPEPTVTIGEPETPPTTTTTTTTTTMTTTSTTTTTTTTIPESCIPGVPCDIPACTGWVYLTANDGTVLQVRDSNGNTKYDQICCSGIVSGITPL